MLMACVRSDIIDVPELAPASARCYRSYAWKHFRLERVVLTDGVTKDFAKCLYCDKGKYVQDKKSNQSTGNMRTHLLKKHPDKLYICWGLDVEGNYEGPAISARIVPTSNQDSVPNLHYPRSKLLRFIILTHQPFQVVEDESFRDLLRCLNPVMFDSCLKVTGPTIKTDILKAYSVETENIKRLLQKTTGVLSFTHDCWTSKNMLPFIAVTGHWLDNDWQVHEVLVGFLFFPGSHTGKDICDKFITLLNERDIKEVLSVTMDNASINDTFTKELEKRKDETGFMFSSDTRVRCLAHVLNISVQEMLKVLKSEAKHEENDYLDILEQNSSVDETADDICSSITKLRRIVVTLRLSPLKGEKLSEFNVAYGLPDNKLILDVKTRWGSTYAMIKRGHSLRQSLTSITTSDRDLNKYHLDEADWVRLTSLMDILKDFNTATKRVSQSKSATLSLVMPIYVWLLEKLERHVQNSNGALKTVASKAKDKVEKYFKLSETNVYWISMVMNPTLKLDFAKEHFDKNMCKKIKAIVLSVYTDYYEKDIELSTSDANHNTLDAEDPFLAFYPKRQKKANKGAELQRYLKADVVPPHTDIMQWWKVHEIEYQLAGKMARDFLAIQGSSVPPERIFSKGSDLVRAKRCSLKPETICAAMCLREWWTMIDQAAV